MKLIIILLAFGMERFLSLGQYMKRFSWFEAYLRWLAPTLEKTTGWGKPLQLACVILPIPVIAGVLISLCSYLLFGILGFILGVIVLLYCLGPEDLFEQVHRYTTACGSLDLDEARDVAAHIEGIIPPVGTGEEEVELNHRNVVEAVFIQSNDRYFAVLFWFIVLGPFGTLLYRSVSILSRNKDHSLAHSAERFRRILDWLPIRLVTFSYLLMGHFVTGFRAWWDRILDGLNSNDELLMTAGFASSSLPSDEETILEPSDVTRALQLVERALYVWAVVIALVTLGGWLF